MRIKPIGTVISFGICALIAFAFFSLAAARNDIFLLTAGSFICTFVPMFFAFGAGGDTGYANVIALSIIFFVILLASNIIFAFFTSIKISYIIVNGIFLLIYLGILSGIMKAID